MIVVREKENGRHCHLSTLFGDYLFLEVLVNLNGFEFLFKSSLE